MNVPTKETFERYVSAFRDAESRIYDAVKPFMAQYIARIIDPLHIPYDFARPALIDAAVCTGAAYLAVPSMDLVPTESGFAVVSNGNLAPASKERVEALRESLRQAESDARDDLLFALYADADWRETDTAQRRRTTLLWCPTLCRRYGITAGVRYAVYAEEFRRMAGAVHGAHVLAEFIVGPEQMAWLVAHQDEADAEDSAGDLRLVLREHCRRLMAAHIMGRQTAVRDLEAALRGFLKRNADELPEYSTSRTREAADFITYQNKKDDACFFFG